MEFFNQKEEVLDIQLTQYGKHLLSRGALKPVYYSFFDEDILYDGRYALLTESQNNIEPRIQENTPRLKTQYSFASAEDRLKMVNKVSNVERNFSFVSSLGTSDLGTQYSPKWNIRMLEGEISGSIPFLTSSYQTFRIPQIDIDIKYKTSISVEGELNAIKEDPELSSGVYGDGTYISVEPYPTMMHVLEEYSVFSRENFDIEVLMVETEVNEKLSRNTSLGKTITELTPLYFSKEPEYIKDGILLDEAEEVPCRSSEGGTLTPECVEYYFDIFVDNEIDEETLCASVESIKSQGLYVDIDIQCPDTISDPLSPDIYTTNVTEDICDEECDDQ